MGARYVSVSATGYDSSPPPDDGTVSEANRGKWSTIKSKLTNVLKTTIESVNSGIVTALDTSPRSVAASGSTGASDHWRTVEVTTATVVLTLAAASSMAAGYIVNVANQSAGNITVACASGDTIDTVTNTTHVLAAKECREYIVNAAAAGYITKSGGNEIPAGVMWDYGGLAAPGGWLACDGTAVSRTTYARLFAAVATAWGPGDGSTTFNLPDFRRRVAVGSGGSGTATLANSVASTGGEETHTLTAAEIPNSAISFISLAPSGGAVGGVAGGGSLTYSEVLGYGGGAHNNIQPSAIVLKIIKT